VGVLVSNKAINATDQGDTITMDTLIPHFSYQPLTPPARRPRQGRPLLARTIIALAVLAAGLALTAAAGARANLPPGGGSGQQSEPTLPPPKPNLTIGGAVTAPFGTTDWEIRYTILNRGSAPTGSFHAVVQYNGTALLKDTAHPALQPGTSTSLTFRIPRNLGCYIPIRFFVDSTAAVAESNEYDNSRWAVGLQTASCPSQPKYKVKAVSFHANDESGADWLGSDEPYWIFSGVGMTGTATTTGSRTFADIDTGDTANFSSTEGCMYLSCTGGTAPVGMGFSVQLWEHDFDYEPEKLTATADLFRGLGGIVDQYTHATWLSGAINKVADTLNWIASWTGDDLIGSKTYTYDPAYLASRINTLGGSFTDTRTYSGGGGEYTMTVLVTRTF
jgi:hypothetical protein